MGRNINKIIAGIIIIWIAIFIFQKDILAFINGWGPSWFKDVLLQIVGFMVHWTDRAWDLLKFLFNWVLELISKIISSAIPLITGVIKGIADLIIKMIKAIIDSILQPLLGKFLIK